MATRGAPLQKKKKKRRGMCHSHLAVLCMMSLPIPVILTIHLFYIFSILNEIAHTFFGCSGILNLACLIFPSNILSVVDGSLHLLPTKHRGFELA